MGQNEAGEPEEEQVLVEGEAVYELSRTDGAAAGAGPADVSLTNLALTVAPRSGEPLRVPLREIATCEAGDYRITLGLLSRERLVLSQLGLRFEDLARHLSKARNELLLKDLLMQEKVAKPGVEADFAQRSGEGVALQQGRCEVRLYETALVVLPDFGELVRVPFSEIKGSEAADHRLRVTSEYSGVLEFSGLGYEFDPLAAALSKGTAALAANAQALVKELMPSAQVSAVRQIARLMREGHAARRADIEAVGKGLFGDLERRLEGAGLGAEYAFLKGLARQDQVCVGFKRGLIGGPEADYLWVLVPVYSEDPSKPGNAIALEAAGGESGGRATYFFRLLERAQYAKGKRSSELDAAFSDFLREANRALVAVNFRREPIYLPDDRLVEPRYQKYRFAIEKIPGLRTLRERFIGRVVHASEAQWRRDVESLLAFNVRARDDGEKWAPPAAGPAVDGMPAPAAEPQRVPARTSRASAAPAAMGSTAPPAARGTAFVIEGLFVIYQDGRLLFEKTDIGEHPIGDPQLVSSMFTAVQQFIKDSFSAEGELNKMGYGENQILIERGRSIYMAAIVFGEPDRQLKESMEAAIEKIEYDYAGLIDNWDGSAAAFPKLAEYVGPVAALTEGATRTDVLLATATRKVNVVSQIEFFQGFIRLKVGVKNDTESVITRTSLDVHFNDAVLRLQKVEPAAYKCEGSKVTLGVLDPFEKTSVAFYFDPQICTETNIDGVVSYRDAQGALQTVTMKVRRAEVVCPLFFTQEQANTATLKRLIEGELQERDSKVYRISKLAAHIRHADMFELAKAAVLAHDVRLVREFVEATPFAGEAWFYGETKVKGYRIVIRTAVRQDNTVEFFAASSEIRVVTGLLAELNHTLMAKIVERYADVKLEQVFDEALKLEVQSRARLDRLAERPPS